MEILIEEFGILGFGIRNPRHEIQNPGLPGFPYMGREGDALTPDATKLEFINDFIYLGLAAPVEMKMALRADVNKVRLGKA